MTLQALEPIAATDFGIPEARRLLLRAGFGGTPEEVRLAAKAGPEAAVDALLDFSTADAIEHEFDDGIIKQRSDEERRELRQARRAGDEAAIERFRKQRQAMQRADRRQVFGMRRWWLERMLDSPAPMQEKLTLFWHGHFATGYRGTENSWHLFMQNGFFRDNAAGSFADLLHGIVRDPAMLAYLNNNTSRKDRPNENLSRELMELFSLGAGNYTERDIKEGARALTGYQFRDNDFFFNQRIHDTGTKSILGRRGPLDGEDFVDAILEHPACARFIVRKLHGLFAMDHGSTPPARGTEADRVIDKLADRLRRDGYRIRPTLRTLLLSRHFYSRDLSHAMIRSPIELIVQTVRSLGAPITNPGVLVRASRMMGQELFQPPNVAGWPGGRTWISSSTLFARQNTALFMFTGKPIGREQPGDRDDAMMTPARRTAGRRMRQSGAPDLLSELSPSQRRDADAVAVALLEHALGGARSEEISAVIEALGGEPNNPQRLLDALVLITAMPRYQLC